MSENQPAEAPASAPDGTSLKQVWQVHRAGTNASEAVYLTLRELISSGVLKPGGHLAEPVIAEELGISRTPIREALLRLEHERLLERTVGRRLVVAAISPEEILDVYAVREVLNGLAARLAAQNASRNDLVRLRRLNREMRWALEDENAQQTAALNFEFHDAVCAAGRNAFLEAMLRKAHETQSRYPGSTFSVPERAAASLAEHEAILEAIEAGDADRAEQLALHHTAGALKARIAMLDGSVEEQRRRTDSKADSEGILA